MKRISSVKVGGLCMGVLLLIISADVTITFLKPQFGKGENPDNLKIGTYFAGDNQPTHPSVYDFGKKWNGWRYWMAYSPYPYGNGEEENPCIAVSDDLRHWTMPRGLHNPVAFNEETGCDELKDPHIVYNNRTDSLEIWYLGRVNGTIAEGSDLLLMRKTSANGTDWSRYEVIDTVNGTLSPSIVFKDGKYRYWTIRPSTETEPGQVLYSESADRKHWKTLVSCTFDGKSGIKEIWHGAVSCDSIFRFVFVESSSSGKEIAYAESRDGKAWTEPVPIILKGTIRHHFYRPCILSANDSIYCFYGTVSQQNKWGLSMSSGADCNSLNPTVQENTPSAATRHYYTLAKSAVHSLPLARLLVLAALLSLLLSFLPISDFTVIWLIMWLTYSAFMPYPDNLFSICLVLIVLGGLSFFFAMSTVGLRNIRRHSFSDRASA